MNIVDRAIKILTQPKAEWAKIASEPATTGSLIGGYAAILALLPAIGSLLGAVLIGNPYIRLSTGFIIASLLIAYLVGLLVVIIMGYIAGALAPSFSGQNDGISGMKLTVYSATPVWVVGLLSQLLGYMNTGLGILVGLIAYGYAAYLIYLGSRATVNVPEDKAIGYTAVLIVIWIVVAIVIGAILGLILFSVLVGSVATGAAFR